MARKSVEVSFLYIPETMVKRESCDAACGSPGTEKVAS